MATYQNIKIDDMRSFLKKENGWREETGGKEKEAIFQFPLKRYPHVIVKVFTGIKHENGESRKVGRDAIRVCSINTKTNDGQPKGFIKSKRVHRVAGWQKNLKNRVIDVIRESNDRASQYHFDI